jgi:NADPH:quinone reductase-like Zn-dependent oxidoreductase
MFKATTVTVHDCLIRRGQDFNLTEPVGLPATSGCDFIGFVSAAGENVTAFKPNDRVAGLLRSGGNARYVQVSQESLVAVPASLDGAEAACMVSVYTSAYQAINLATRESSVYDLEGKQVLVVGGMDGIGQAIIHMCSKANAEVFATAPDRRHAYVRSVLNATPLPENPEEWGTIAKNSMDVVFDGECQGNMDASLSAMNKRGQMICFGNSTLIEEGMGWFGVPVERRLQRMSLESKPRVQVYDIWDNFRKDPDLFKVCSHSQSLLECL